MTSIHSSIGLTALVQSDTQPTHHMTVTQQSHDKHTTVIWQSHDSLTQDTPSRASSPRSDNVEHGQKWWGGSVDWGRAALHGWPWRTLGWDQIRCEGVPLGTPWRGPHHQCRLPPLPQGWWIVRTPVVSGLQREEQNRMGWMSMHAAVKMGWMSMHAAVKMGCSRRLLSETHFRLHLSTRTTCLQGPPVYKDHLSTRTTCLQRPPEYVQGRPIYRDHLHTRTTCVQGPPVYKDHLYTRTTCTETTCLQRPPSLTTLCIRT